MHSCAPLTPVKHTAQIALAAGDSAARIAPSWAEHDQLWRQEVKSVKVQRFYRPEDISKDLGYRSGFWDIYASSEQEEVDVGDIQYMCRVQRSGSPEG